MRILRVAVCVGVLAAFWGQGARVWASCPDHVAMGHFFDSYFACDDGVQTAGFSYQQSDPLNVNTGTAQITCQGFAPDEDSFCPMSSGLFGDQRLAIGADWMSGGMIGCPIAESVPRRVVIAVVAPGPLVSSGLLVSLSGADTRLGYAVEAAHPLDASQTQILPAACATTLQLVNATGLRLTTRSTLPPLFTDCDTNSAGQVLASTCPDDFHPVASFGFLYTKVVPCGYIPEIRTSAWTNTGVVPDADGDATVTVDPAPRPGE